MFKDDNGEPASGMFSYINVVGMLLYMSGYNRPYVSLAVNICVRYMFSPKISHKFALKRLAHYLKLTNNSSLVLKPNPGVCKLDTYPDADFSGKCGHEEPTDPSCVNICTGFIITFAYCSFLWVSKLQANTALSTMEAKMIPMDHCCRKLFPIIDICKFTW